MIAADYLAKEPPCEVIGPQIGPIFDPCGVRITIALPHRQDIAELTCRLFDANGIRRAEAVKPPLDRVWRQFLFPFDGLNPGQDYSYRFFDDEGHPVDLQAGLSGDDCRFRAPEFMACDRFVLLSCNNPFYSGQPVDKRFAMWERLLDTISGDDRVKLLIQGGDQVYHDDLAKTHLKRLTGGTIDRLAVIASIIRNYQHFYGCPGYRKIMARVPSVAMLDDHDITDGWGGDPGAFDQSGAFKPEWQAYLECAYGAFKAYQTSKNPPHRIHKGVETTFLDFGDNRLYLLDLRREKNIKDERFPLVSAAHEQKLLHSIDTVPQAIRRVFVLSPVVPVRIDPKQEEALTGFFESIYKVRVAARKKLDSGDQRMRWRFAYWLTGLGSLAYLTDDLSDSLSSKTNRRFLISLVTALAAARRSCGDVYFLSGDIHSAGISEIFVEGPNGVDCIPQIVSSPMGYAPMDKYVKDGTTEEGDFELVIERSQPVTAAAPASASSQAPLDKTGPVIRARNIFYRSDRNFCIVKPGAPGAIPTAEFHFESLREPLCCPVSFFGGR